MRTSILYGRKISNAYRWDQTQIVISPLKEACFLTKLCWGQERHAEEEENCTFDHILGSLSGFES